MAHTDLLNRLAAAEYGSREDYIQWHAKSEAYVKRRVKQQLCGNCRLWTWPDERCARFVRMKEAKPALRAREGR